MAPAASAATFSNNHGITINDSSENCSPPGPSTAPASATPYPSEIAVSGLGSSVSALNVSVSGLSHTLPDDLRLLLVSPASQSTVTVDDGHGATAPVKVNVIAGSDKKETINGTSDADMIFGLNGDDTIKGEDGNGILRGG